MSQRRDAKTCMQTGESKIITHVACAMALPAHAEHHRRPLERCLSARSCGLLISREQCMQLCVGSPSKSRSVERCMANLHRKVCFQRLAVVAISLYRSSCNTAYYWITMCYCQGCVAVLQNASSTRSKARV
jgi:hypothetical protein